MEILLSIKPEYWDQIRAGKKTVEVRSRWRADFAGNFAGRVWICPSGTARIAGWIIADHATIGTPKEIWSQFGEQTGLEKGVFFGFLGNKQKVYAIPIREVVELPYPIPLAYLAIDKELPDVWPPPQSWRFLPEETTEELKRAANWSINAERIARKEAEWLLRNPGKGMAYFDNMLLFTEVIREVRLEGKSIVYDPKTGFPLLWFDRSHYLFLKQRVAEYLKKFRGV